MDTTDLQNAARSERVAKLFDVEPTDYQAKLLDYGESKPRAQTAPKKGRQVGATLTAGLIGADHALSGPKGTDVLFAAPSQGTANEMFREAKKRFWNSELSLEQFGVVDDNKETWEFVDGTRILSRTLGNVEQSNNSGNRGMSPTCVIVDEAAYTKDAVYTEEIRPFFITHETYEFHLFSTPAGKSGYFYEKASEDHDGIRDIDDALDEPFGWYAPYWPTRISPFAQEDEIANAKENLTQDEFAQEYLGEFTDPGGNAISHDTLVPNIKPDVNRNPKEARYLAVDPARKGNDEMVVFDMAESGKYWNVWAFDEMDGPRFVEFLKAVHTNGEYPAPEIGQGTVPNGGYQTILIEENGVGGFGADFAQAGLGGVVRVVTTSNKTKQNIYQRLIKDLEGEELALPNHPKLVKQTTALEKTFTPTNKAKYEHPPGKHDDWPDACAFVNWARHGGGEQLQASTNSDVPLAW